MSGAGEAYPGQKGVMLMEKWPRRFPDLIPIENLWSILARKVSDCGPTEENASVKKCEKNME